MPVKADDKENAGPNENGSDTQTLRRGKTVEQIYQKKTQLEHILLRPDTYVGSTEHQFQEMFVFDQKTEEMVHRKIDYVPALYKIFDEILVNAADNSNRDPKGMDLIDVTIDQSAGSISVMNNGKGVPVVIHKEHKCYVPELIFGHLLTGDNYDDNEKKVTGGRNGYGAKLTNVFSKKFMIETTDKSVKKKFTQIFEDNMSTKQKPKIADYDGKEFTRVTFWPDLSRFGMTTLDDDIVGLMMKRTYDIAGSTAKKINVKLNGKPVPVTTFEDYCQLYTGNGEGSAPPIYERVSDRWEIAVGISDNGFQQVSFTNSICTIKGGTHVAHVTDQIVEHLLKVVKNKNRGGMEIKPQHVKNHLFIFVNSLIENPAFDSQTKDTLTTKQSKFGSSCDISEKLIKQVMKSGIVDTILDWVKAKQKVDEGKKLKGGTKNQTRVLGIPKLEDANDAGTKNSEDCTLILTEGDSAKALAMAGVAVVGRDKFGVFPLKGKLLNVRDANFKQVTGNAEIQNLLKIMGLDTRQQYDSVKRLRYGSIMIMTDQDHDGSHIKGLLLNLVSFWWPSLLQMDGFLKQFVTPIVKVWKQGKKDSERKDERCFFTMTEYEQWKRRTQGGKAWQSKYYKGLGTSTAKEAKEYFKDIENHEMGFKWKDKEDDQSLDLAFNKKRADDRKEWINNYEGSHVDHSKNCVSYFDFVHKELVQFAKYDTSRSVPSVVDGFKTSQRKVLFCAFKKKLNNDIKVAQFVGYVSEKSAYHHGETSLENTIVNLAQDFVGSNNVNLLFPSGQFGTRSIGGKDHAAARYIYTRLMPTTRMMFHPDDDPVLDYLDEEGQSIEPRWYCPILPMVLVNGADGIGTGWSTSVPNYNPRDIIRNMQRMLRGEQMEDMSPWYKGFKGSITHNEKEIGKFELTGCIEKVSDTTLVITELPVRTWTQSYKEFLEELMPQEGKKSEEASDACISDFKEHHTENAVQFEVILTLDQMAKAEQQGLEKMFKLKSSLSTSNMVLFDHEGKIAKYNTALDILKDFCKLRRQMYDKRKAHMVAKLSRDKEILSNKARFILMVVKGELELRKRKKADLLQDLQKRGFKAMSELDAMVDSKKNAPKDEKSTVEQDLNNEEPDAEKSDYDYLLGMNLWSLTFEKVEEIKKQLEVKEQELKILKAMTIETMWDRDLAAISKGLDDIEALEAEEVEAAEEATAGRRKKAGAAGVAKKKGAPKASSRKRSVVNDSIDEALMSRPVQVGAGLDDDDAIHKQSWGRGAPLARQAPPSPGRARGDPDHAQEANSKGKGKGRKDRREISRPPEDSGTANGESDAPPTEPPQAEDGGSLLSRLLKNKPTSLGSSLEVPSSGFSALSGSDDFFSYLSTGNDTSKPYDAMDFGAPPCGESFSAPDPDVDEQATKQPKGRGRAKGRGRGGVPKDGCVEDVAEGSEKGPGRSRKQTSGSVDTGGPPKRQKKDMAE